MIIGREHLVVLPCLKRYVLLDFGMDKGWREITSGADIKVPNIYKFIIKYITPVC
jgi:SNF family Na+-dependent transporter